MEKQVMFIHVFPKSKFTECHVTFINSSFSAAEHEFILYTNKEFRIPDYIYNEGNVYDLDKEGLNWFYKKLQKADGVIFHTLGINLYALIMLFLHKEILRKSMWLIWGADLYCYREPKESLPDKIVEYLRKEVISCFAVIATLTQGDYVLARKWYHVKAPNVRVDYYYEREIRILQALHDAKTRTNTRHRILLGNSATKTNRHEEILNFFEKFKEADFELIVPLSYGDMEYGEYIEKIGTEKLGDKFIPIMQYMELEQYYELLNSVDAAIFNNDRQQALGNIAALLYLGKKVYMRRETTMWEELVDIRGYRIHSIEELSNTDIESMIYMDAEEKNRNFQSINELYSVDRRVKEWREAFSLLLNERKI
ncbi:MAG: TDP-N-acetylfucosamine:lipid II N-acetylfucosaminyltransferase [Lachnospiraceae bacterium]|nr:TDP-N-acetylfucosamine:lipid II N-acetylfucosaminyltransferase [Lachnospiraceae bacterium]